jgi:hypothetical protein
MEPWAHVNPSVYQGRIRGAQVHITKVLPLSAASVQRRTAFDRHEKGALAALLNVLCRECLKNMKEGELYEWLAKPYFQCAY